MKKHFLLLLLMTLLPLAGWATDYEVQVTTWDGTATWTGAKPVVQPDWFSATFVGGGALNADQKAIIATGLKVKDVEGRVYNAGTYEYQLALKGGQTISDPNSDDTYKIYLNSSTTATLTITKVPADPVFDLTGLAYVTADLAYNPTSEGQALLSGGATATSNGTAVPVIYTLNPNAETVVTFNNFDDVKATDAGDYTVYYKVAGTDNYVGSDWTPIKDGDEPLAKNIAKIDNAITTLTLAGWTYDPAKTAAPVVGEGDADIHIAATYGAANATFTYKKGTGEYGSWADVVGGHAGGYKVKATIAASTNYNAVEAEVEFTIAKATPVLNVDGVINTAWNLYDGGNHNLFLKRATATIGETTLGNTAIYYNARYKAPGGTYGSWFTAKTSPTNSNFTNKKNAGSYQVQVWVEGTDDYNAVYHKPNDQFVRIDVAQADITGFTDPVAKTGLRVKGDNEGQDLVEYASWGENTPLGTFKYKVGEADWSADAKGTTAGTYSVNFQMVPTDAVNYKTYTIAEPLSVTIADKSTVTIAAKANQTFGYGTTPVIDYTTVWTEQGSDELDVTGMEWNWYTNSDCSTSATVDGNGNFTVGDYFVKASGATVTGTTAASQEIVYTPVAVKITAGQVTAKISGTATYGSLPTFTLTHVSGLSPAEAENFNAGNLTKVTIKQNGEVVNNLENVAPDNADLAALAKGEYDLEATASCGTNYAVVVTGEKLTVGAKSIVGAVIDVTTDANAIVYNNKAWGTVNPIAFEVTEISGIEAADYDVAYSNNVNAGTATITLTGKRNYDGTVTKDFTIKKAGLTIKADDTTWIYGTTEPTYAVTVEGQAEGETALEVGGTLAGIDGALTVVRTSNETVGAHAGALVAKFGSAQPLESDNYTIIYSAGNLQIAQAALTIKLKNNVITGTYGDNPADNITATILTDKANYELDNSVENNELPDGNLADILDVSGVTFKIDPIANNKYEVNDAGYEFTMTGATTTNYAVTISNGTYKVNTADITLYAKDQVINWADEDNTNDEANTTVSDATVAIAAGALKCGDALTDVVKEIVIASQNVGTNNISLTAAENANYNIVVNSDGTNTKYGVLTVTGAPALVLSTADADLADKLASYNGKSMPVSIDFTARNGRTLGGTRNWEADSWVTLTLPFDISVKDLSNALGYAIVNVIDPSRTEISGTSSKFYGKLTMKGGNGYVDPTDPDNDAKKDTKLAANKPFLVKTADAITGIVDFGTKTIVAPASADDLSVGAGGGAKFTGTYASMPVDKTKNAAIWFMLGNYEKWAYITTTSSATWNILPFEGFIDMSGLTEAQARNMTFVFEEIDGSTTAIKSVSTDDLGSNKLDAKGWYNLNGMKMDGAPLQKGIYIKDGKKVVIK